MILGVLRALVGPRFRVVCILGALPRPLVGRLLVFRRFDVFSAGRLLLRLIVGRIRPDGVFRSSFVRIVVLRGVALLAGIAALGESGPRPVIVTLEQSAPIGQNAFSQSAITLPIGGLHHVAQQRVHRAGHDLSRQHPDLAHRLAPRVVELACEPSPAQLDDGVLHDDIAGQLPRLAAIAMLVERMAEYAVHDQMQVIAHRFLERLLKPRHDARRVV